MASLSEIRTAFLDYFKRQGHAVLASSPLVPQNDPTLLFTNAGMVQFKNIFTGAQEPPAPRAVTSQKCVRAGGKHNDLDNVGYTARHHTFFEMLGNFSFGDYFKDDAIAFAWELVTKDYALDPKRLTVTVYADDEQAAAIWRKVAGLPDSRIIRIPTSDNFWMMGPTGPCGPCSEIFFDHGDKVPGGPPGSPDADGDRFVEVWNLVFMQFEQIDEHTRIALPKPSIDTGMGLERIAAVLQGVHSNYDTDLFRALIAASEEATGMAARGEHAASHRVIADHLRASCFLIADGVGPSNEGRGYVLRRIMRRAMRHAHLLGAKEPLLHRLVATLAEQMGGAYPELVRARPALEATLREEEERFQRTLGNGMALLEAEAARLSAGGALPGETAFKLYDTYGFPLDLTQDILRGRGQTVDLDGFETAMERQREASRAAGFSSGEVATDAVYLHLKDRLGPTRFVGYDQPSATSKVSAILIGGSEAVTLEAGQPAELLFDTTPFYAESGGQAGDKGLIVFSDAAVFKVEDTHKRAGALHGHSGALVSGRIKVGAEATLTIDADRRSRLRANHSATHLLHAALRHVLGPHVTQKGSLVEADRLRFDFSHGQGVTQTQLDAIEAEVNGVIRQNGAAETREMAPEAAVAAGALALFGEKYGDSVRVLSMGASLADAAKAYSVELCGGTHVTRTGDIAVFAILSESAVSAGVRRIEAATGAAAIEHWKRQAAIARTIADDLKSPLAETAERVATLARERRSLERDLSDARTKLALAQSAGGSSSPAGPETVAGIAFLGRVLAGVPAKDLRALVDDAKKEIHSGVIAFIGVADGKAAVAIGVTPDLAGKVSAVDLVKPAVAALGGHGGGGRADMAQGGGPNGQAAQDALSAIRAMLAG
jgi:alanyl-tRNA synthetase